LLPRASHAESVSIYGWILATPSFLWFQGLTVTIDKPGEPITAVAAISGKGLMFGNWGTETEQHAGYYDPTTATWTKLPDIAGYPLNIGSRMNERGHAVGSACSGGTFDIATGCKGWLWDGHKYEFYSVPGATDTFPNGINNKDIQVGLYQLEPGVYPGFRRYHDQLTPLIVQTPAGPLPSTAYDINENGTIVGVANLDPNDYFPSILIYPDGSYKVLPKDPTVVRTFYLGMNEREDLAGSWFNDPSAGYFALVALRKHAGDEH
jgi:hypothetical protein